MRALAVTNPSATAMSPRTRDVIIRALGSELKVDVAETTGRGHAAELAAQARADDFDLVIAVGGDGTVNEVVDGLLRDGAGPDVPRLAVVPGGNANVFARALGLPGEPIEATGVVIERLRARSERAIGLGRLEADGLRRWFTFCAGFGLDAEVVREVERARESGARATPTLFARTALRQFFATDRRRPALTIERPGDALDPSQGDIRDPSPGDSRDPSQGELFLAVITNTTPWTYFGERPLRPTPDASFDTGLDVFALRRLGVVTTAAILRRLFAGTAANNRRTAVLHDQHHLTVRTVRPIAMHVDGEYLGEITRADLYDVPEAIAVVA